jgi:hypothetical protein
MDAYRSAIDLATGSAVWGVQVAKRDWELTGTSVWRRRCVAPGSTLTLK